MHCVGALWSLKYQMGEFDSLSYFQKYSKKEMGLGK